MLIDAARLHEELGEAGLRVIDATAFLAPRSPRRSLHRRKWAGARMRKAIFPGLSSRTFPPICQTPLPRSASRCPAQSISPGPWVRSALAPGSG